MNPGEKNQAVVDSIYAQYTRANFELGLLPAAGTPDSYEDSVLRLLAEFAVRSDDPIVDLACGDGRKLASLRSAGYSRLTGCDKHVEAASREITHVRSDIHDFLKGSTEPIKCIILYDIVEHLDASELVDLLRAAEQRMADGGLIIIRTTNGASPLSGLYYFGDLTHKTLLNEFSIGQLALLTGLEVNRVLPEEVESRRFGLAKRLTAKLANRILRTGLAAVSLLAFRRIAVLTPNFTAVLTRKRIAAA